MSVVGGLSWSRALRVLLAGTLGLTAAMTATAAVVTPAHATGAPIAFEQDQRVTSMRLMSTTDTFATANAFGGAFGSTALSQLQTSLDAGVKDGSLTILLEMLGLEDLTGTSDAGMSVGVLTGTPDSDPAYDGTNDLDWWYQPSLADIDATGAPHQQLAATIAADTMSTQPGHLSVTLPIAGVPTTLSMSAAHFQASVGPSSSPTLSSTGTTPGHLASDGLPPTLTSFGTMTGGRLAGNVSAAALAAAPMPNALIQNCDENYTIANTILDLMVSGCRVFFTSQVSATQPDTVDPDAAAAGSGGPYKLSTDSSHHVNGCVDKDNQAVDLATCLSAAAYSAYFQFTTDRVIVKPQCSPGGYSAAGFWPCTLADPGYYVADPRSTAETPCPTGLTSSAGASACSLYLTASTVSCARTPVPVGVATACRVTVADQVAGPTPAGSVTWSGPVGGGKFSAATCTPAGSGSTATCSVTYTPAYKGLTARQLHAAYAGDGNHAASSAGVSLRVSKRASRTTVGCSPLKLRHGTATVCTVKVADVTGGTRRAPTGYVRWSAPSTGGVLSAAKCRLAGTTLVRSCHVRFTTRKSARGTVRLTAKYLGDGYHLVSTGTRAITVT
ncbi:MAG TPA: hypothetical protein VFJ98_02310 [Mycobacteriales bacterium]|nr:hypothetical protein [Mycobacteriales bacterium]